MKNIILAIVSVVCSYSLLSIFSVSVDPCYYIVGVAICAGVTSFIYMANGEFGYKVKLQDSGEYLINLQNNEIQSKFNKRDFPGYKRLSIDTDGNTYYQDANGRLIITQKVKKNQTRVNKQYTQYLYMGLMIYTSYFTYISLDSSELLNAIQRVGTEAWENAVDLWFLLLNMFVNV